MGLIWRVCGGPVATCLRGAERAIGEEMVDLAGKEDSSSRNLLAKEELGEGDEEDSMESTAIEGGAREIESISVAAEDPAEGWDEEEPSTSPPKIKSRRSSS